MKVYKKAALIVAGVIAAVIVAGLLWVVIFLRALCPPELSKEETEKDFLKNQEEIMLVANYLMNANYETINIDSTYDSEIMFTDVDGNVAGDAPQAVKEIKRLLKRKGYKAITKNGNTICFQRSVRFNEFCSGVVYSMDGVETRLEFLTKLEPLPEQNWFYYEEDFNEWKRLNNP